MLSLIIWLLFIVTGIVTPLKKKKQASYIMALRNFEPFVIFVKYFLLKDI